MRKDTESKWSAPQLFSDKINTIYDEHGPYLHPDGKTMYFSSNGLNSVGGFDIFKTVYSDATKSWSDPENIGFPTIQPMMTFISCSQRMSLVLIFLL
ncbi:MAG: PD40 domain-containing protein [Cytophagaceae bacterium]|nr:PD40 domain-containing protein [Cytophagaceae bacterium]